MKLTLKRNIHPDSTGTPPPNKVARGVQPHTLTAVANKLMQNNQPQQPPSVPLWGVPPGVPAGTQPRTYASHLPKYLAVLPQQPTATPQHTQTHTMQNLTTVTPVEQGPTAFQQHLQRQAYNFAYSPATQVWTTPNLSTFQQSIPWQPQPGIVNHTSSQPQHSRPSTAHPPTARSNRNEARPEPHTPLAHFGLDKQALQQLPVAQANLPQQAQQLDKWQHVVDKPIPPTVAQKLLHSLCPPPGAQHMRAVRSQPPPPALGAPPQNQQQPADNQASCNQHQPLTPPTTPTPQGPIITDSPPIIVKTESYNTSSEEGQSDPSCLEDLLARRSPSRNPPTYCHQGLKAPPQALKAPTNKYTYNATGQSQFNKGLSTDHNRTRTSTPKLGKGARHAPGYPQPLVISRRDLLAADKDLTHVLQAALRLRAWLSVVRSQMHGEETKEK